MSFTKMLNNFKTNNPNWQINEKLAEGKDGSVYSITNIIDNRKGAVKLFKDKKSLKKIKKEFAFFKQCSDIDISPKIYNDKELDEDNKYFMIERMEYTLLEFQKKNEMTLEYLKEIINLYMKLSELKIFHNDGNIGRNIMFNNGRFYLIDFGFSNNFNKRLYKQFGENPNISHINGLLKYVKKKKLKLYLENLIDNYEKENNVIINYVKHERIKLEKHREEMMKKY